MKTIEWYQGRAPKDEYEDVFTNELVELEDLLPHYQFYMAHQSYSNDPCERESKFDLKNYNPQVITEDNQVHSLDRLMNKHSFILIDNNRYFIRLGDEMAPEEDNGRHAREVRAIYPIYPSFTDAAYAIDNETDGHSELDVMLEALEPVFFSRAHLRRDKIEGIPRECLPTRTRPVVSFSNRDGEVTLAVYASDKISCDLQILELRHAEQLQHLKHLHEQDMVAAYFPDWLKPKAASVFNVVHEEVGQTDLARIQQKTREYVKLLKTLKVVEDFRFEEKL